MTKIKIFFQLVVIVCISFVIIGQGGCEEGGCGGGDCSVFISDNSCSIEVIEPWTEESCKEDAKRRGCKGATFVSGFSEFCPPGPDRPPGECRFDCCPICGTSPGFIFKIADEKSPLTILSMKQDCDLIVKGTEVTESPETCENQSNYRVCNSFEFFQSEEDKNISECWLYECQDCLLE